MSIQTLRKQEYPGMEAERLMNGFCCQFNG